MLKIKEGQTGSPLNLMYTKTKYPVKFQVILKEERKGHPTLGMKWSWKGNWYGWWMYLWPLSENW